MSIETLFIAEKFCGPPRSGNGGYVSGVIAAVLSQPKVTGGIHDLPNGRAVEVTLRALVPLDRSLAIRREGDALSVVDGDTLIAEAAVKDLHLEVPQPVKWDEALAAQAQSYSLPTAFHPLFNAVRRGIHPICFCCGAELAAMDGLHVYSAPVRNNSQVAAAWIACESYAGNDGTIPSEFIWTALDCPGQMAWMAAGIRTGMLGRLTARVEKPVLAGERCVVIGWTLGAERKKYFAGTALFNEAGELCAYAKAVWIGRVA